MKWKRKKPPLLGQVEYFGKVLKFTSHLKWKQKIRCCSNVSSSEEHFERKPGEKRVNRKRYPNERRFWTKKFIGGSQNRKCGSQNHARSKIPIRRLRGSAKSSSLSFSFDRVRSTSFDDRFTRDDRKVEKRAEEIRESPSSLFVLSGYRKRNRHSDRLAREFGNFFRPRINSSVVLMTTQHGIIPRDFSVRVRLSRGTNLPVKLIALTRVGGLAGKGSKREDRDGQSYWVMN